MSIAYTKRRKKVKHLSSSQRSFRAGYIAACKDKSKKRK